MKHEIKNKKVDPKLGKLGATAATNEADPSKKDKGVKNSCEGKDGDIMKEMKTPKLGHNTKKPKLGDELLKYPKDRK